eukprot:CAMPEP_0184754524 /NCGR_PEP_ID=MMETSP0315-20130426/44667_1 /TAXON_ID=101924 /ORGANISM="Rhodosorus marinus, Strain UTEX LB 2760" /LENGTH=606 /DNA_ID=CAMNT_0027233949 /DNA_START=274 /DNA_END=2094 /DNA_ORIENTATION=+
MEVQSSFDTSGGRNAGNTRRPGRPATYIFDRPDDELTEEDRKLKNAVLKRRSRQNRSYQKRKMMKVAQKKANGETVDFLAAAAASTASGAQGSGAGSEDINEEAEEVLAVDLVDMVSRVETQPEVVPTSEELGEDLEECVLMAVKGTMDRSLSISHSSGVKDVLFGSLRDRFAELPHEGQGALRALSVFPRDFDMASAAAVMGRGSGDDLSQAIDLIQPLFTSGFISSSNGRFELNQVTKLFLTEEVPFGSDTLAIERRDPSVSRYIDHFQNLLSNLTDPSIHKLGFAREHAMQVFDTERQNMDYAIELSRLKGPERLREFLAVGAAVMRYCVDAATRIQYLQAALEGKNQLTDGNEPGGDRRNVVRLELARAEALCDNQSLEDAEEPLKKAMELMDRDFTKSSNGIMDTVLVLLLFAGVKINLSKTEEGHKLLVEALRILNKIGLGKTTLAVNALTNLVTIYVQRGQLDRANYVATELLNTLHAMRYDKMPIYADALGVLAMVRMAAGDYTDAARQFGSGLEIVAGWGSKSWTSVPVQHCLDLDIWLMEGLAISLNLQGLEKDAKYMVTLASDARLSRRLKSLTYDILGGEHVVPTWLTTSRHLY